MRQIIRFKSEIEIYSIDEAFMDLYNLPNSEVENVVNKIEELVGTEYENTEGETKKYTYGDFAILTRQRNFGDKFVNGLNVRGIPSTHIGDFNIFETAIISELMLYLRVLEAPTKAGMYLDKLMTA